jgi:aldose 1-epimerase
MPQPTGEQFVIVSDSTSATITEIGATLRAFTVEGEPIVWGFGENEMSSFGRGQVLAPWPNRLQDGAYSFGSRRAKAPLDEPERHNSIHGIVRWLPFAIDPVDDSSIRCTLRLGPQPAYPWWWRLEVTYTVGPGVLDVSTVFENLDDREAPFALGFHPYLAAGSRGLDASRVAIPAGAHLVANERMLPIGTEPVGASPFASIVEGQSLKGVVMDDAFGELVRETDGRWRARFWPDGGRLPVVLWGDESFTHVMCFTGETLADSDRRRALALEPMTAPPNALATGDGIRVVEPGARFSAAWGIKLG